MSEELPSSPQQPQLPPKPRLNLQELRNSDLVSRLLAATPPYLYSSPVGPHNFFFSEMLRSLVQARNAEQTNTRNANTGTGNNLQQMPMQPGRRPRKRAWSQQRTLFEPTAKEYKMGTPITDKNIPEKPLELTNKHMPFPISKYQKCESPTIKMSTSPVTEQFMKNSTIDRTEQKHQPIADYPSNSEITPIGSQQQQALTESPLAAVPPSDLVLPPPPPMWYPPLYPPYGIDPLHFFIDLRVSGHIYDRKKENISPTATATDNNNITINSTLDAADTIGKNRHGSAFSVPPPRREKSPAHHALNLTSSSPNDKSPTSMTFNHTTYDHSVVVGKDCSKNTNYVLQNLPRIYTNLSTQNIEERNSLNSEETDSKSDFDVQEIDGKDDRGDDSNDVVVIVDNKPNKNY